jgi:hypothetical protein
MDWTDRPRGAWLKESRWILEGDLSVLRPCQRGRATREGFAFMMEKSPTLAHADDRRVAGRTVSLLACAYGGHGEDCSGKRGDKLFMSPLRRLCNR